MFRTVVLCLLAWMFSTSTITAVEPTAYVINSSGETLSKINLTTGIVDNDILTLGSDRCDNNTDPAVYGMFR